MVVTMPISGWLKTHLSIVYLYEASALLLVFGILNLWPLMKKVAANKGLKEEI